MSKKIMKTLLKILAIIIILVALFFAYVVIRTYTDDWRNEQKLLKHPISTDLIGRENTFKKELIRKNNSIIRVDIYDTHHQYGYEYNSKSLDECQLIGRITDDNQLKRFKKAFEKIVSSNRPKLEISLHSNIWINIIYEDGTNVIAEIAGGRKGGRIRIHDYRVDEIPKKNNHKYIVFKMSGELWEIIKDNMISDYKNKYKSF